MADALSRRAGGKLKKLKALRLGEFLMSETRISQKDLQQALTFQAQNGLRLGECLIRLKVLGEIEVYQAIARSRAMPFVDLMSLEKKDILPSTLRLVPIAIAQSEHLVPLIVREIAGKQRLCVATSEPFNLRVFQELEFKTGFPVSLLVTNPRSIRHFIRNIYPQQPLAKQAKSAEDLMGFFNMHEMQELDEDSINLTLAHDPRKNKNS